MFSFLFCASYSLFLPLSLRVDNHPSPEFHLSRSSLHVLTPSSSIKNPLCVTPLLHLQKQSPRRSSTINPILFSPPRRPMEPPSPNSFHSHEYFIGQPDFISYESPAQYDVHVEGGSFPIISVSNKPLIIAFLPPSPSSPCPIQTYQGSTSAHSTHCNCPVRECHITNHPLTFNLSAPHAPPLPCSQYRPLSPT